MADNSDPAPIIAPTIVVIPEQITALAKWLDGTMADSSGIFQLADSLLTALHYDLNAQRTNDGESAVIPSGSLKPIGVLPGWCADGSYWPNAYSLKTALDKQMADLYTRLVDPDSTDTTTSVKALIRGISSTLRSVAKDYDTSNARIMADLNDLDKNINSPKDGNP